MIALDAAERVVVPGSAHFLLVRDGPSRFDLSVSGRPPAASEGVRGSSGPLD